MLKKDAFLWSYMKKLLYSSLISDFPHTAYIMCSSKSTLEVIP